eukprot:scaffold81170_cov65-Attheya_sp.AAC.2
MIRTLRKDISGYNEMQTLEEAQEETGWKLVHGDVFRPPSFSPMLLSVCVGTGVQIGTAFGLTMVCAIAKLVSPMKKGQTLMAVTVMYVLCGSVSGYVSSRIYKFCDEKAWKRNILATAAAFPGVLVAMFLFLDFFLAFAGTATSVWFFTIIALFLLWICVSTLVSVQRSFMFRQRRIKLPVSCPKMFVLRLLSCRSVAWSDLWEVSMVMCYLQLCGEDHHCWWNSFFNCASAGIYLFLYALWFLSTKLELVGLLPMVVYLTYMSMISLAFSLFCGSVGFLSAFMFNQLIYGALKVD